MTTTRPESEDLAVRDTATAGAPFLAASAALAAVFLASGMPIPLYSIYRAQDGITDAQLATATAAYLLATACSLLFLGRLSDHLGRRPVALAAVVTALAGATVMLTVDGPTHLVTGRILQGVACGLASSAIGTLVVDTAPARPRWLAGVMVSILPPAAVPLGALLSGLLSANAPQPRTFSLTIAIAFLLASAVALLIWAPTPQRRSGAWDSMRPRPTVPDGGRAALPAAAGAIVAGWCIGGFYQAFAPAMAAQVDASGPGASALMFVSAVALLPVGGLLTGRFSAPSAVRLGVAVLLVGYLGTVVVLLNGGPLQAVVVANLVAGLGNGAAVAGATRLLLGTATPLERAGTIATVYLISYAGAAIPSLVAGRLSAALDLSVTTTALGYAALAILASAIAVVGLRAARSS